MSRPRPRSGDVWSVRFGTAEAAAQAHGIRPAVVVSCDGFNDTDPPVVMLVPTTTTERRYPYRVRLRAGTTGLRTVSWAAVEHLRSVSTARMISYLGHVEEAAMDEIDRVLRLLVRCP